jgi:hypothetical protein
MALRLLGGLLGLSFACALSRIRVDNSTRGFVDEQGRARVFRGVNAVYKVKQALFYPVYVHRYTRVRLYIL